MPEKLSTYHAKRNFGITPEPKGALAAPGERLRFVVQKHDARKLHYDFRLELEGTLKSWAVPKGPSLDPAEKRLAVHVEDHPLDYIDFEGDIPAHQYGAGHVDVWDTGYWEPQGDPLAAYRVGKLKFRLDGEKLHGGWTLVRTRLPGGSKEQWLLIKERDEAARAAADFDITAEMPDSVLSSPPSKPAAAVTTENRARKAKMPKTLSPQLATLVDELPQTGEWEYEIKFDGYRLLARVEDGTATLLTRDGKDWTKKLPRQAAAIEALGLDSAWLDGEVVVLGRDGMPSFQLLQNAFDAKRSEEIVYFLFDLPYLNGHDLRKVPLRARRQLLQQVLAQGDDNMLRFSAPIEQAPQKLLDGACAMAMEGIIGKRADSLYTGKRSDAWIKLKCRQRQEFVIAGYTEPQGSRKFFGALLLAVNENGRLRYSGRVGTGFGATMLREVHEKLRALERPSLPFAQAPQGLGRDRIHWVEPQLVAEVSFAEWTEDGIVRQASFHGLRMDKPASAIVREKSVHLPSNGSARRAPAVKKTDVLQGIRISNPDRVIDRGSGLRKLDVALYYETIASRLLPFLKQRPVYLLRAPEGITGEQFFQKHSKRLPIPGVRMLDPALDPGHDPLMVIESAHALVGAAQMGMIELHTCNATANKIDRPDCMVFDLDPDPDMPWKSVVEAAYLTKVVLDELGLKSFLKTSGGKGLHLVVPLSRRHSWETVAGFSQAVAQHLARMLPRQFSAKMGAKNRVGKIFVDYLRNRRQASTVAPYSLRARPGLPVAVPIAWEELPEVGSAARWTLSTLTERFSQDVEDPWRDYFDTKQSITAATMKKIGMKKP